MSSFSPKKTFPLPRQKSGEDTNNQQGNTSFADLTGALANRFTVSMHKINEIVRLIRSASLYIVIAL